MRSQAKIRGEANKSDVWDESRNRKCVVFCVSEVRQLGQLLPDLRTDFQHIKFCERFFVLTFF